MSPTVIIFGPTGQAGSVAARTARSRGAKVILGMRDTSKPIPGLSKEQEKQDGYERVQADLSNPASLVSAVKTSGATRAFIYIANPPTDHMRGAIEALKSAGIEFVVFLSSFSLAKFGDDLKSIPRSEIIPWVHAQVEINLDEIFGPDHYVAVRPGFFASNLLRWTKGIGQGGVKLFGGHMTVDCIVPHDIGAVSGAILATQTGPKNGQREVYLYGPQRMSLREAISKVVDQDTIITSINEQEALEQHLALGIPKPMIDYMLRKFGEDLDEKRERPFYEEGVENVQQYTGARATTLEQWAEANTSTLGGQASSTDHVPRLVDAK